MSKSGFSGKTHTQAQLDDWANRNNPNNPAYRANVGNRSNQMNPNNPAYGNGSGGRVSGKTHTKAQLDDWANRNNPNNPAYRANVGNRSSQMNPNNPVYRAKAAKGSAQKNANADAYRQTERLISGGAVGRKAGQGSGKNGPGPKGGSRQPSAGTNGKAFVKKPTQAELDAWANQHNPNNPAYRANPKGRTHQQIHNAQRRASDKWWGSWTPDDDYHDD